MLYLVLALIALLPACLGQQQDCVPADFMAHVMFVESDVDGDGVLHLRELIDVFREYDDVDSPDGIVTREEYVKYQTRHDPELDGLSHELYNVYDVNNDHRLTMDDYDGFYRQMDVDTDDSVTEPEFTTYWTKLFNSVKHHTNLIC